ncbi:acid phosphatase/phosphotransferase [Klebsiella pneumoniae]|uniref:Acid phosphatase/phosphotransferase n=1 Tax=Klebsiella pneumoniae TaxID=573 RepID=A0A377ZSL8_KLEPN|nr:acid phosphatase/phosphotransferase [Klebsiella pneumoniae]
MNNGWDEFSMPKEVARQLIAMHVKRGDSIVRHRPQPDQTETVSKPCRMIFSSRPPI